MTTISHSVKWSPIGAIELKRTYQRNFRNATLFVVASWLFIFLSSRCDSHDRRTGSG